MDQPLRPDSTPATREKSAFLPVEGTADASFGKNRKILIVDDNAIVVKTFQLKLKASGFNVLAATNATEGISAARQEKPEAIILDLNFPAGENFSSLNWSGLNILQWLKRYKDVANIPIIILTGEDGGKSKAEAFAAGAVAFFQKPVDLKEFLAELLTLIGDKPPGAS